MRVITALLPAFSLLVVGAALAEEGPEILPAIEVSAEMPSLTVPDTEAAAEIINRTPGAVDLIPAAEYRFTPAATLKDVFDYTPGVFAQTKWGEDTRLSIRGSGLSRNFHLRGIQLYQDGIPLNFTDGSADFQEIDPAAYRYVEVYKGGNGLVYGSSTLGGAINFVTPTGYDADLFQGRVTLGSYGFRQVQMSSGAQSGAFDGFITGTWLKQDGFRDHSEGESFRGSANIGWRLAPNIETRFYLNAADIDQRIPGSVSREQALTDPKAAAPGNLMLDYQRNMQTLRFGNKTTVLLDETTLEFGFYGSEKNLIHPIYQYIDYKYRDYGFFGRVADEREIAGHENRFTLGLIHSSGRLDNAQYANQPGAVQGGLISKSKDSAQNTTLYGENAFEVIEDVSLVLGGQYVWATRDRQDLIDGGANTSGGTEDDFFNPKIGLLWQVKPDWQVFANVTRSTEMVSFSELNFTNVNLSETSPQRATTWEVGTRGGGEDFAWDLTLYHARLKNEFLFEDVGGGAVAVYNAGRTTHQGVEAQAGLTLLKGLFEPEAAPDRIWGEVAYTLNDFTFDGGNDAINGQSIVGNDLPGAPRHYIRARLLYKSPAGYAFGPNVEWVPQGYHVDSLNTADAKTGAYALLGFGASYDREAFSVFLDARNLLDEKYISSVSTARVASPTQALYEPGTGRTVFVGASFNW